LHCAVEQHNRDFVVLLLQAGANANVRDSQLNSPLAILCSQIPLGAISHHRREHSLCLSQKDVFNEEGNSQYHGVRGMAALEFEYRNRQLDIQDSLEEEEIIQALLEAGADPHLKDFNRRNALMAACEAGNVVLAANIIYACGFAYTFVMLVQRDVFGRTAFHLAVKGGHIDAVKLLTSPMLVFRRETNFWRQHAVDNLSGQQTRPSEVIHD
jgi:ankyrin repeat protein